MVLDGWAGGSLGPPFCPPSPLTSASRDADGGMRRGAMAKATGSHRHGHDENLKSALGFLEGTWWWQRKAASGAVA